jgi:hypothetical protein
VCGDKEEPSLWVPGEGHGRCLEILERALMNLPVYGAWNGQKVVVGTGESLLGPVLWGREAIPAYNQRCWEMAGGQEAVGGGHRSVDGAGQHNRPEQRTPASSMHACVGKESGQCPEMG